MRCLTKRSGLRLEAAKVASELEGTSEALVASAWANELGRAVGRNDNFFDVGGHSLLAVKVFRHIAEVTGAPISLTDVFRFPTVRTLADRIRKGAGDDKDKPNAGLGRAQARLAARRRDPAGA